MAVYWGCILRTICWFFFGSRLYMPTHNFNTIALVTERAKSCLSPIVLGKLLMCLRGNMCANTYISAYVYAMCKHCYWLWPWINYLFSTFFLGRVKGLCAQKCVFSLSIVNLIIVHVLQLAASWITATCCCSCRCGYSDPANGERITVAL